MSLKASASRHIYYEETLGTLTAFLFCSAGDIWQDYANPNDWVNDSNYTPQFSNDNPRIIELILSATGTDDLRVASAEWTFNGINCTTEGDYFQTSIIDDKKAQLKIKGNVGKLSHNQSILIKCKAMVGTTDSVVRTKVEATIPIAIRQQTKDTYRCTIAATNAAANYTIGASGEPVGLQCIVYDWQGNVVSDPAMSYAWTKMVTRQDALDWVPLGGNNATISVGPDDVDNQAMIKVEVTKDSKIICADTQVVYDNHDPIVVEPRFDPEDCTIRKGDDSHDEINVYLDLKRASDGGRASSADVTFVLLDTTGNEVQDIEGRRWENVQWVNNEHPASNQVNQNKVAFTITADDFANGGKELILQIEADVIP